MLWWQPEHGGLFGYDDGWSRDGAFFFSGMGQFGDQRFGAPTAENGRLRDHARNGDRVRLLRYLDTNLVKYVCELRLDLDNPWQWRDAPDLSGVIRRVIQFRLSPVGSIADDLTLPRRERVATEAVAEPVTGPPPLPSATLLEDMRKPSFLRLVKAQRQAVQRVESQLVQDFGEWLTSNGVRVTGLSIPYAPEQRNLRADLFVPGPHALVEAKASTAREHIRMAIGQLLDYARFVKPAPRPCLLTPARPPDDMLGLLSLVGIDAAWADASIRYEGTAAWLPRRG